MNTAGEDTRASDLIRMFPRVPRLPQVPRARFEGSIYLVLGLAALALVWLLQSSIVQFVPRAGTFAERLRDTPEILVSPSYAQRIAVPVPAAAAPRGLTLIEARPNQPQPSNAAGMKPVS